MVQCLIQTPKSILKKVKRPERRRGKESTKRYDHDKTLNQDR